AAVRSGPREEGRPAHARDFRTAARPAMTRLENGLAEVAIALDELDIPYMLIGGLAVAQWEEPRATVDIDVTIWVAPDRIDDTIVALSRRFAIRSSDPARFVGETHVLPMATSQGIPVDLLFALWPIEREAIENAVERSIGGHRLRVVPLNYLIFMKFS